MQPVWTHLVAFKLQKLAATYLRLAITAFFGNIMKKPLAYHIDKDNKRESLCAPLFFKQCYKAVYIVSCKVTKDSLGWWTPCFGFQIPPLSVELGFWIPIVSGIWIPWAEFRNPKSRIPDSTSKNFRDSRFLITLHGVIWKSHCTTDHIVLGWCCITIDALSLWCPKKRIIFFRYWHKQQNPTT